MGRPSKSPTKTPSRGTLYGPTSSDDEEDKPEDIVGAAAGSALEGAPDFTNAPPPLTKEDAALNWLDVLGNQGLQMGLGAYSTPTADLNAQRDVVRQASGNIDTALGDYQDYLEGLAPIEYGDYAGDYESEAAKAYADQESRAAQYENLGRLRDLTSPEMTAQERFLMERARQGEERDQRAAREAALSSLAQRGQRSGAAELAAVLGGQQQTSQNRLLQDLGAQANAVDRAMRATELFGNQANTLSEQTFGEAYKRGQSSDAASEFNKTMRADRQRDLAEHERAMRDLEMRGQSDLTGQRLTGERDKVSGAEGVTAGSTDIAGGKANVILNDPRMVPAKARLGSALYHDTLDQIGGGDSSQALDNGFLSGAFDFLPDEIERPFEGPARAFGEVRKKFGL